MSLRLPVCALLATLLPSCGGAGPRPAPPLESASRAAAPDGLLAHVPADTPYVLASLAPLPRDLRDRLDRAADRIAAPLASLLVQGSGAGASPLGLDDLLLRDLGRRGPFGWLRGMGLGAGRPFVLYGDGLLPVLRVDLADPAAFRDWIATAERESGASWRHASLGDIAYTEIRLHHLSLIVSERGGTLVLALVFHRDQEQRLPRILGASRPKPSLAETGSLRELPGRYGLLPALFGYLDLLRLADAMDRLPERGSNRRDGPTGHLLGEPCRSELLALLRHTPRLVLGLDAATARRISARLVLESDPDIAAALRDMARPVAGGAGISLARPLLSFIAGVDLAAARAFLRERFRQVDVEPYRCRSLHPLNRLARAAHRLMRRPFPIWLDGFRGLHAMVLDADPYHLRRSVRGWVVLHVARAQRLLSWLRMALPLVRDAGVRADGVPVPLGGKGQQPWPLLSPFIAVTPTALALTTGIDPRIDLPPLATPGEDSDPPLLSIGYDIGRGLEAARERAERKIGSAEQGADQASAFAILLGEIGDLLGFGRIALHAGPAGPELRLQLGLD